MKTNDLLTSRSSRLRFMIHPTLELNPRHAPYNRRWLAVILLAVTAMPVFAQAYRWIGPDGSLHLSDRPPPGDALPIEPVEVPHYRQPALPADQNPYSIINQLKRLEENRMALRERQWQERLEELEQRQRQREISSQAAEPPITAPVYLYPPPTSYQRPRHRHRWRHDERPLAGRDHPSYRVPRPRPAMPKSNGIVRMNR